MTIDIPNLRTESLSAIAACNSLDALENARVALLGKKGKLTEALKTLGQASPEERKERGAALNKLKDEITQALETKKSELSAAELNARLASEKIDVTLPASPAPDGRIHPVTQVIEEISAIFAEMGFSVADGPDIEDDEHNFNALNIPASHPARQMHDTFYLPSGKLLRTHTSPVQIRTMRSAKPPFRVIAPGSTYRCDSDLTHTPMFHQVEGFVIDKHIHMGHLKGCIIDFLKAFFEIDDVPVRFRPSFFPFTEPSAEVDIGCTRSKNEIKIGWSIPPQKLAPASGVGGATERRTGAYTSVREDSSTGATNQSAAGVEFMGGDWLEVMGCGMVHPNVLKNCGINPDEWQGFAFGLGVERLAMLKYGIPDLRTFFESDVRWLKHFGFAPLDIPGVA